MPSYLLGTLDMNDAQLSKDLEVMKGFPRIAEEYDEFSTGFWMNNSLWNASGDESDTMYRDFDDSIKQTEYGRRLPYIEKLIRETFTLENMKMVRLRTLIDGMVIPHKDFVEVKEKSRCLRVFIPLEDNELAFHSDEEAVFRMRKGEVWFLDAAIVHAAVNFSNRSRTALCLDYIFPEKFSHADIFVNKDKFTPGIQPLLVPRQELTWNFEESLISPLSQLLTRYNFKEIVFVLSKIHFYQNIPISACYDWLIEIAKRSNDASMLAQAESLRTFLIVERKLEEHFAFNDWEIQ